MCKMKFTDTVPTEPGLYWAVRFGSTEPFTVDVVEHRGKLKRYVTNVTCWDGGQLLWGDRIDLPEVQL